MRQLFYHNMWHKFITKCVRFLIIKCDSFIKNATIITKCVGTLVIPTIMKSPITKVNSLITNVFLIWKVNSGGLLCNSITTPLCGFYMKKVLNKLIIVSRGFLTPTILWRCPLPPPIPPSSLPPLFFSNFVPHLSPLLFLLPCSLTKWVNAQHLMCYFLLQDIMGLDMSSLGTLVPQGPCRVFFASKHQFAVV